MFAKDMLVGSMAIRKNDHWTRDDSTVYRTKQHLATEGLSPFSPPGGTSAGVMSEQKLLNGGQRLLPRVCQQWFPWLFQGKLPALLAFVLFFFFSSLWYFGLFPLNGSVPDGSRLSFTVEASEIGVGFANHSVNDKNEDPKHWGSFTTSIPMYYINLDKSEKRRDTMEETFANCGRLRRVPAVDGAIFQDVPEKQRYLRITKASTGELALFYSHLKAIKYAYDEGQSVAIIFEDDVSTALVAFWRYTPDELVQIMDDRNVPWDVIRLEHAYEDAEIWGPLQRWKENPDEFLRDASGELLMGASAYMISRAGMKSVLEQYTTEEGKFDCLAGRLDIVPCLADWILFQRLKTFIVEPPMFVQGLLVGSTAIRQNDNWKGEQRHFVDSLLWAMQDYEVRRAAGQGSTALQRAEVFRKSHATRWEVKDGVDWFYGWRRIFKLAMRGFGVY